MYNLKMDLEFLNDIKNNVNQFSDELYFEKCPKCQGFSFTNSKCQNCNYDAKISLIGEVLGDKSFYSMKESLYNSVSDFEKRHQKLFREDIKFKQFINKVKLRYNDLLDYLYSEESLNSPDRAIYLHELRDVIIELYDAKVDESEIWHPLKDIDKESSLFNKIREVVLEVKNKESHKLSLSLNYKFAGILSLNLLIFILMTVSIFICLSLAFISYYKFN